MSKDIYIDTTAISSSVLKDVIANLETAQRKLSSMSTVGSLSRLSYRDPNGMHSLFTTDIGYDAVAVARDVSDVLEEVRRYAALMNSVCGALAEIDENFCYVELKQYSKIKDWTAEKLEWVWEKLTGYDLDTDTYLTFIEDVLFELPGLDLIETVFSTSESCGVIIQDINRGTFSMDTVSRLYKVFSKGVNKAMESPLTPVELKVISHTLKSFQKYGELDDKYREIAVDKTLEGDYWAIPVYLSQAFVLLGKELVDVMVQTVSDVFMLDVAGSALSMITGYDVPGKIEDFGTAISDFVDDLFGM